MPAEDFCDQYVEVTCSAAQQCGCLQQYSYDLCVSFQGNECADEYEDRLASGRFHYDPISAGQCLHGLRAILADCSLDGDDYPASCDAMLVGVVPEGGSCEDSDACSGSLECVQDTCTRLPGDGEACQDGRCAEDLFCGKDDACHRYRGIGGDCAEGGYVCDDDLYCDPRTETCQPYLKAGAACDHATWACDDDLQCTSGTCQTYPGPGSPCADDRCAESAYCDEGTCRARKPDGSACTQDEACLSDECDGGTCMEAGSDICSF